MNGLRTCLSWVMLSALFHVSATGDPVIELRPISASGAHVIAGNQITLAGTGQRVFLEVLVSNWDPDLDGSPSIAGWQAFLGSLADE